MRIVHTLATYLPDSIGGLEVYVRQLTSELRGLGVASVIAAPRVNHDAHSYDIDGTAVFRYPARSTPRSSQYIEPFGGFDEFAAWLRRQELDVYHQHAWWDACQRFQVQEARLLGLPTVLTMHSPSVVCARGIMMEGGVVACDGKFDVVRCTTCVRTKPGLTPSSTWYVADEDLPDYVRQHNTYLNQIGELFDRIVVPSQWLLEALRANGLPLEKLVLCRQGIGLDVAAGSERSSDGSGFLRPRRPLRVGFFSRLDRTKGLHVLVQAVRALPIDVPITLIAYAVQSSPAQSEDHEYLVRLAGDDPRIELRDGIPPDQTAKAIADLDVMAVPSQWLETGPLVVLEAHAAGVPVIGSKLGGIVELVNDGVDGCLVVHDDVEGWSRALAELALNPAAVDALKRGVRPPRSARDVATEMVSVYEELLAGTRSKLVG